MKKLRMETKDQTQANIDLIADLFPSVITEMRDADGQLKRGINFEHLKQELSGDVIDGEECYDFTWVGKKSAMIEANTKIRKTLRPVIEESKDWETTENLYIEGDNLDALKLLQESYLNSVKMIYIDPPYNTGNDSFVYPDNYTMDVDEYDEGIEYRDEDGNIHFRKNNETNPRFHSDWCSMMYPRLRLARNLLREDGVIFISIDDNEVHTLKHMCNEVFGEFNFAGSFVWRRRTGSNDSTNGVSNDHEYVMCYFKSPIGCLSGVRKDLTGYTNPDNDPRGPWTRGDLTCNKTASERPNLYYPITDPKTGVTYESNPNRVWAYERARMERLIRENKVIFPSDGKGTPTYKRHVTDLRSHLKPFSSVIETRINSVATKELRSLLDAQIFDHPKSVDLLRTLTIQGTDPGAIILDFFAGSSTTAQAVMQLNAEDGGSRKFIMVQLPEETDEKSEAYKAGYRTISDLGKERIRRAGDKIKAEVEKTNKKLKDGENPKKMPDIGFRVLKVDSTNMNDVYYAASDVTQDLLIRMESNVKEDRTDLDLLYGVLVEWGLPLSLRHEMEIIDGVTVHTVDQGSLVACFAEDISEGVVREIAKRQPLRVVFRDSSFASSPGKINVTEIFKLLSPNTSVRVI